MERRDKNINGTLYSLLLPPVRQAMPLCTRVAALLGPVLGTLGEQAQDGGWARFAQALQAVDPDRVDALLMDAARAARLSANEVPVNDGPAFERWFGEHRADVYLATSWALWESVRDFFPDLSPFTQKLANWSPKGGFASPTGGTSTTGSDGPSGPGSAPGPNSPTAR